MAVYKRGKVWWFKFVWRGALVRESTKQGNKRTAEIMEAGRKTELARGEVGIRDREPVPTLAQFAEAWFLPHIRARFKEKAKTLEYYQGGAAALCAFQPLANCQLDQIDSELVARFISRLQDEGKQVSTINRRLEVLRRMLRLAAEEHKVEKSLLRVKMLPGERRRDRVLSRTAEIRLP